MGKAVLIFLLGSMAIFGIINLFNNYNVKNALGTSVNYYSDNQARDIGNTTMQMLLSQLADNTYLRVTPAKTINLFNGSAQYTIVDTVFASDSLLKVNVYANYKGTTKTIVAYFKPPQDIPSFLTYALLSGGNIKLTVSGFNVVSNPPGANANVFANGDFTYTGPKPTINGFLNYTGNLSVPPAPTGQNYLSKVIPPIPNGLPAYGPSSTGVSIPAINQSYFKSVATVVTKGDTTLTGGTFNLGTKTTPLIVFVNGNMTLTGTVFKGYGAIYVKGNLKLTGNNTETINDPQGSPLVFYVGGNTTATGTDEFSLITMGTLNYTGTLTVKGSLIANQGIDITASTLNIQYSPPVSYITQFYGAHRPADVRYYLE